MATFGLADTNLPVNRCRVSAWLDRAERDRRAEEVVARIVMETGCDVPDNRAHIAGAADAMGCRGVPIIGKGLPGGTSPGTAPESVIDRMSERRRRLLG